MAEEEFSQTPIMNVEQMRDEIYFYIKTIDDERVRSVYDYVKYIFEQPHPIDDYDYELAARANERIKSGEAEFVTMNDFMRENHNNG
jgi:predicted DNA-binding protein